MGTDNNNKTITVTPKSGKDGIFEAEIPTVSVTFTFNKEDAKAVVKINGETVNGSYTVKFTDEELKTKKKELSIEVTNGTAKKTYTLKLTYTETVPPPVGHSQPGQADTSIKLPVVTGVNTNKNYTVKEQGQNTYQVTVAEKAVTVTVTAKGAGAKVWIDGEPVSNKKITVSVALKKAEVKIKVEHHGKTAEYKGDVLYDNTDTAVKSVEVTSINDDGTETSAGAQAQGAHYTATILTKKAKIRITRTQTMQRFYFNSLTVQRSWRPMPIIPLRLQ